MNDKDLKCPICGEPTYLVWGKNPRKDGLCKKHADQLFNEKIEQCSNCNKWIEKGQICDCKKQNTEEEFEKQEENKCLLCDEDSGKYLFCKKCFSKYYKKTLLLKIKVDRNQKLELLNESYEGVYTCKDGHIVKSKSERDIDNYLFEHQIAHAYEKPLVIGKEIFKPDFYLKDKDVYLEHWGYDESNKEYTNRKEYKLPKYKEKGITLIQTNEKDMQDVETSLELKLTNYIIGEINEA